MDVDRRKWKKKRVKETRNQVRSQSQPWVLMMMMIGGIVYEERGE